MAFNNINGYCCHNIFNYHIKWPSFRVYFKDYIKRNKNKFMIINYLIILYASYLNF